MAVAWRLAHGAGDDFLALRIGVASLEVEGTRFALGNLFEEQPLEVGQVALHSFFGHALHAAVDGGVDLQAIGVEVVGAAVGLGVVGDPVLHVGADVFAQVGGQALVVSLTLEAQDQRKGDEAVRFFLREEIVAFHLAQDGISAR